MKSNVSYLCEWNCWRPYHSCDIDGYIENVIYECSTLCEVWENVCFDTPMKRSDEVLRYCPKIRFLAHCMQHTTCDVQASHRFDLACDDADTDPTTSSHRHAAGAYSALALGRSV